MSNKKFLRTGFQIDSDLTDNGRYESIAAETRCSTCLGFVPGLIHREYVHGFTLHIPKIHVSLGSEDMEEYLSICKEAGFPFQQVKGTRLTFRRVSDGNVNADFYSFYIDANEVVNGEHALATISVLRYLYFYQYKGMPEKTLEMFRSGLFTAFQSLLFSSYIWPEDYSNVYSIVKKIPIFFDSDGITAWDKFQHEGSIQSVCARYEEKIGDYPHPIYKKLQKEVSTLVKENKFEEFLQFLSEFDAKVYLDKHTKPNATLEIESSSFINTLSTTI